VFFCTYFPPFIRSFCLLIIPNFMRIIAYLCHFARSMSWKALEAKMSIFMNFGGHKSQMEAQYEAMEMNATLLRKPKICIFNGVRHLGKPKQKRRKRSRCCNSRTARRCLSDWMISRP